MTNTLFFAEYALLGFFGFGSGKVFACCAEDRAYGL